MEFRRFQSTLRLMSGILLTISMASCHYNMSFKGYTFVLPEAAMDQYNRRSLMMLSFSDAQRWCKENVARSTLAVIPNKDVQRDLSKFIESAIKANDYMNIRRDINNIRVNGKYNITDGWRWVNGHSTSGIRPRQSSDGRVFTYASLWAGYSSDIYALPPDASCFYICEHQGSSIQCKNALLKHGRCYHTRYRKSTWYDARNDCLDGGGDLASLENFEHNDIKSLTEFMSLNSSYFWIGIQKNPWRWDDTGSDITYSYWTNGYPHESKGDCLCLNNRSIIGAWMWIVCDCTATYPFICLLNDTFDSSSLTHSNENRSTELIVMVVSCAAIFVVIIIISAVLIIRKRRENDAQKGFESRSTVGPKSSDYEAPNHAMESSTDPPVYEEIQKPRRTCCASDATYASVEMTSTAEDKHPVNNIVYAELDLTSTA